MITTTSSFTADYLLEKKAIWGSVIPGIEELQKDEPWSKVVLHGIPIADFDTPEGIDLAKEEIQIFNKGLKPIGTPYWLTSASKRQSQLAGALVVSFATEAEASRAIRQRVYIGGISARVEKHYAIAPSVQCSRCQGFGYLENLCRRRLSCRLCSEPHATSQHICNICKAKGTKCPHLVPKCSTYKSTHTTDYRQCETLQAIKSKSSKTTNTTSL